MFVVRTLMNIEHLFLLRKCVQCTCVQGSFIAELQKVNRRPLLIYELLIFQVYPYRSLGARLNNT